MHRSVVQCLPSKLKALGLIPSTEREKSKRKKEKKHRKPTQGKMEANGITNLETVSLFTEDIYDPHHAEVVSSSLGIKLWRKIPHLWKQGNTFTLTST